METIEIIPDQLPVFQMISNKVNKLKQHRLFGAVTFYRASGEVLKLRPREYLQVPKEI